MNNQFLALMGVVGEATDIQHKPGEDLLLVLQNKQTNKQKLMILVMVFQYMHVGESYNTCMQESKAVSCTCIKVA